MLIWFDNWLSILIIPPSIFFLSHGSSHHQFQAFLKSYIKVFKNLKIGKFWSTGVRFQHPLSDTGGITGGIYSVPKSSIAVFVWKLFALFGQWLTAVVSLQTSIARHLAQQQLNSDPASTPAVSTTTGSTTTTTAKPTASVQPVKQERPETPVAMATCPLSVQQSDSKSTLGSKDLSMSEKSGLLNGALSCASQDQFPNGPMSAIVASAGSKTNGPVSLLQPGTSTPCTSNGDVEVLKASDLLKASSHKVVSTGPGQSVVKLTVPCTSSATGSQSRNIVISTVNKATGALGTKVVSATPAQAGKVFVGTQSKNITGSNTPTSILNPRVTLTPTTKVTGTPTQAKAKMAVTGSVGSTGTKVITVTTPAQGKVTRRTGWKMIHTLFLRKTHSPPSLPFWGKLLGCNHLYGIKSIVELQHW